MNTVNFNGVDGVTVSITCGDDESVSKVVLALCCIIADIMVASGVEPHEIDELSRGVGEAIGVIYTRRVEEVKNGS